MAKNDLYGQALRAYKRKQEDGKLSDKVTELMEQWLPVHLSSLSCTPVDSAEYERQIAEFSVFLVENLQNSKMLRLASVYLRSKIENGNNAGQWSLVMPPAMKKPPRCPASRTRHAFQMGKKAAVLYNHWRHDIKSRKKPPESRGERFADVLISAVIHSGLANVNAVVALANRICRDQNCIQIYDRFAWIELIWSSKIDARNLLEDAEKKVWKTLHRFYLDTFTMGLLHSYMMFEVEGNAFSSQQQETLCEVKAWELISERFKSTGCMVEMDSLKQFCRGAQSVTEMLEGVEIPQALLECASGNIQSVSLLPVQHKNWFHPRRSFGAREPIRYFELEFAWTKDARRKARLFCNRNASSVDVIAVTKSALDPKSKGLKKYPIEAQKELDEILNTPMTIAQQILVTWCRARLGRLMVSSVLRYFTEVCAVWLLHTNEIEFDELDEDDFEDLYDNMLSAKRNISDRAFLKGRLHDLHRFGCERYGFPLMDDYFSSSQYVRGPLRVKVGYIPHHSYEGILEDLSLVSDLDRHTLVGLEMLLVLAYRTGLRRGELLKLRLSEIEDWAKPWLFVVNNKFGSNKTDSARRRIPLHVLLEKNEFARVQNYLNVRREFGGKCGDILAFSLPSSPNVPLDPQTVSALVKHLCKINGCEGMTFHHLRHTALTNLMIVLDGDETLINGFTNYSIEHTKRIRSMLHCEDSRSRRDIYYAISGVAGHLTPEVTFSNYIHEPGLFILSRVSKYDPVLSLTECRYISGLPLKRLKKLFTDDDSGIPLSHLRDSIFGEFGSVAVRTGSVTSSQELPVSKAQKKSMKSVAVIYRVLQSIEEGNSIESTAFRFDVSEVDVSRWHGNAMRLQNEKTKQGNPRLFTKRRINSRMHIPLLPDRPRDRIVAVEIDEIIDKLRAIYRESKQELKWALQYWLDKVAATKPGARFTDPNALVRFVSVLEKAVPLKNWNLVLHIPEKCRESNLQDWESIGSLKPKMKYVQAGRSVNAYLHMKHPNEKMELSKRKGKIKQYSASSIRYIFHMLGIAIGID